MKRGLGQGVGAAGKGADQAIPSDGCGPGRAVQVQAIATGKIPEYSPDFVHVFVGLCHECLFLRRSISPKSTVSLDMVGTQARSQIKGPCYPQKSL